MSVLTRKILPILLVLFIAFVMAAWAMHGDSNGFLDANCQLCKIGALFVLLAGIMGVSGRIRKQLLYILELWCIRIVVEVFSSILSARSPPLAVSLLR
jgi:hypothetical protein